MVSKRKARTERIEDFRSTACGENIWFPSKSGNGTSPMSALLQNRGEFIAIVGNERFRKKYIVESALEVWMFRQKERSASGDMISESLTRKEQTIFRRT